MLATGVTSMQLCQWLVDIMIAGTDGVLPVVSAHQGAANLLDARASLKGLGRVLTGVQDRERPGSVS